MFKDATSRQAMLAPALKLGVTLTIAADEVVKIKRAAIGSKYDDQVDIVANAIMRVIDALSELGGTCQRDAVLDRTFRSN